MLVEGEGKKMTGVESGSEVPASPSSVDTQYSEASEIKYGIYSYYVMHDICTSPSLSLYHSATILPHDSIFFISLFCPLEFFRYFLFFSRFLFILSTFLLFSLSFPFLYLK